MVSKRFYAVLFTSLFIFSHASITTEAMAAESPVQAEATPNNSADFQDVIVRFKDKPGQAELHAFKGLGGDVSNVFTIIPAISGRLPAKAIEALKNNPQVEVVELDYTVQALEYSAENELGNSWGADHINADAALASGYSGEGIKVAVLDSGVNFNHFDLRDNFDFSANELGYDFVSDDLFPEDVYGHGTHVAGILAAASNGFGVVGVAPDAQMVALRVLDENGEGTASRIIEALQWIQNYNAAHPDSPIRITNNSYGTGSNSSQLGAAFDVLASSGVLHIGSAGNDGRAAGNGNNVSYPANYESVVAVAALDKTNQRASFSSTGSDVEIAAPGVSILSTWKDGLNIAGPQPFSFAGYAGEYFIEANGTSMASPHVAGVAALLMAADPSYTAEAVRNKMNQTALDLGDSGRDNQYGYGLVDASSALGIVPVTNKPPVAYNQVVETTQNTSVAITLIAADPDGDPLTYTIASAPANGTVSGAGPDISYTPNIDFTGADAFTYEVKDSAGGAATGIVTINVAPAATRTVDVVVEMSATTRKINKINQIWTTAKVKVMEAGSQVADATVTGHWEEATSGLNSGNTGKSGTVSFTSEKVIQSIEQQTFTFVVDSVVIGDADCTLSGQTINSITK
ncbi:S8 family peptidase [Trichococcus collinsii]|uniref:Subtilase family protein n=1 Tax=Trichococcus collinsii TaxID=157076 RepID=A0AB37ZWN5_9LACT|nr:S8 family serine peptidase [Trichococcus collinsii]CZQ82541.1 peptidase s8 subtilisin ser-active site [Trichococcus collinsii]SDZ87065.1 Subtilase family protein [Trichococcus collinsii]